MFNVIAKRTLRECWEKHTDSKDALETWYKRVEKAEWKNFNELKEDYPSADIVGNNRVVFNIKGNNYRLIVKIDFVKTVMFIRFVGTHSEYDEVDAANI